MTIARSDSGTRDTTVWWAAPVAPESASGLVALLDPHERGRLERFRMPADRARYVAAHALARIVLADAVGRPAADLEFDRTCQCGKQHGKPVLLGGPGFSLTHSGDLVGVTVHPGGPVGLDVEQIRDLTELPAMAAHVCSPAESVSDPRAFFALWTRKEALLKATGSGLSSPMTAITLGPAGVREWTGDGAPSEPVWLRDLHPGDGYPAAVAGLGAAPPRVVEADGNAVLHAGVG
ncbi:4'-phosphopantetheinyl transferase family protein [Pseudonocardia xinjiangensis]|uniref:4'-phosphopantetheinyl transferase family protein n=1 Tax=Pseudonocardia xinjiangensis TaxID=75289 RepID=UPI003D8F6714